MAKHKICDIMRNINLNCISYNLLEETNPYLKYLFRKQSLVFAVGFLGKQSNSHPLYKKHFDLLVDFMKMSSSGLCYMQSFLIMTMLSLEKDDEAYDVIKFRMCRFNDTSYRDFNQIITICNSLENGEWLREPNQDKMEDKLYNVTYKNGIVEAPWFGTHGSFLVGLLIIKYKIVWDMEKRLRNCHNFNQAMASSAEGSNLWTLNHRYPLIRDKIQSYVLGYEKASKFEKVLISQKIHLAKMLDLVIEQRFSKFLLKDHADQFNTLDTYNFEDYLRNLYLLKDKYNITIGAKKLLKTKYPGLIQMMRNRANEIGDDEESEEDDDDFDESNSSSEDESDSNSEVSNQISDNEAGPSNKKSKR